MWKIKMRFLLFLMWLRDTEDMGCQENCPESAGCVECNWWRVNW